MPEVVAAKPPFFEISADSTGHFFISELIRCCTVEVEPASSIFGVFCEAIVMTSLRLHQHSLLVSFNLVRREQTFRASKASTLQWNSEPE